MMPIFAQEEEATLAGVSVLRKSLRQKFNELRLPISVCNNIQLAFAEQATNSVKHGTAKPTKIKVRVALAGHRLILEILDNGSPFLAYKKKVIKKAGPINHYDDVSGRGLGLINASLDEHQYETGPFNKFTGYLNICPKRPRVLFIEDDEALLALYAQYFANIYDVKIAASVFEAKTIIEIHSFDLIVADYHLGHDNFFSALEIIEAKSDFTVIPVVVCTGEDNPDIKKKLLEAGIADILDKPFALTKLHKTIDVNIARALHNRVALLRYFSASINKLVKTKIMPHSGEYALEVAQENAGVGGGDIVLHFHFPDYQRIIVADLMGHGLSAAASAISFATMMRSVQNLLHRHLSPGGFLNIVSRLIREDEALTDFMVTFIVLDLHKNGKIEYSSAGHLPPIIINGKRIIHLRDSGPIPGIFADDIYETYTSYLRDNERLCIYTDGIDPQGLASSGEVPEWFVRNLKATRPLSLEDSLVLLEETVVKKVGTTPLDDWTLVLIEKKANENAQDLATA